MPDAPRRAAILLSLTDDTREIEELAFSLGYEIADTIIQRRDRPDPQSFLGSGKLDEARDRRARVGAKLVIVNGELKPSQIFTLQSRFGSDGGSHGAEDGGKDHAKPGEVEVYDRVRVILEIFHERARSQEARLQVELAKLRYEIPLVREAISMAKRGERQSRVFGGGEYEVNYYYDMMKRRMTKIRRELQKISRERDVRRKHRRRTGFHLVSLAGYTNAGKSSLLRALSGSKSTLVENRYFSTLSTQTRRAESTKREILLTDTVGFVENLPPWVVEAFHSTLEEIALSDVILLVVDASDPLSEIVRKVRTSVRVLREFDAPDVAGASEGYGNGASAGRIGASGGRAAARGGRGAGGGGGSADRPTRGDAVRAGARARGRGAGLAGSAVGVRAGAGVGSGANVGGGVGMLGHARPAPILLVLNKSDLLNDEKRAVLGEYLLKEAFLPADPVFVSARTGEGFDALFETIYGALPDYDVYEVTVPAGSGAESLLSWLMEETDVLDVERTPALRVRFEAKPELRVPLEERVVEAGGRLLRHR